MQLHNSHTTKSILASIACSYKQKNPLSNNTMVHNNTNHNLYALAAIVAVESGIRDRLGQSHQYFGCPQRLLQLHSLDTHTSF